MEKVVWNYLFPLCILAEIFLLYAIAFAVHWCKHREKVRAVHMLSIPVLTTVSPLSLCSLSPLFPLFPLFPRTLRALPSPLSRLSPPPPSSFFTFCACPQLRHVGPAAALRHLPSDKTFRTLVDPRFHPASIRVSANGPDPIAAAVEDSHDDEVCVCLAL